MATVQEGLQDCVPHLLKVLAGVQDLLCFDLTDLGQALVAIHRVASQGLGHPVVVGVERGDLLDLQVLPDVGPLAWDGPHVLVDGDNNHLLSGILRVRGDDAQDVVRLQTRPSVALVDGVHVLDDVVVVHGLHALLTVRLVVREDGVAEDPLPVTEADDDPVGLERLHVVSHGGVHLLSALVQVAEAGDETVAPVRDFLGRDGGDHGDNVAVN